MPLETALPSSETVTLVYGSINGGALFAQAILRVVTRSWLVVIELCVRDSTRHGEIQEKK